MTSSNGGFQFDVAIVGGGPAGASCAAACARGGLKTVVLERSIFPREKVCGDTLNPACWPILERLALSEHVMRLPHSRLAEVEFIGLDGASLRVPLDASERGEISIKRSILDNLLLARAAELGAEIRHDCAVTRIEPGWKIHAGGEPITARILVAADGRNSTVARFLNLLPASARDRIGVQTHFPAPADFGDRVVMRFLPSGYCGLASVGENQLNLCLVARPKNLDAIKSWAHAQFTLPPDQPWHTIAPLARAAVAPRHGDLLLVGDAARVVEPFTGEGIFYALASGELAARAILSRDLASYTAVHRALYRGRLWINHLTRLAATNPRISTAILTVAKFAPKTLRLLTHKVTGAVTR